MLTWACAPILQHLLQEEVLPDGEYDTGGFRVRSISWLPGVRLSEQVNAGPNQNMSDPFPLTALRRTGGAVRRSHLVGSCCAAWKLWAQLPRHRQAALSRSLAGLLSGLSPPVATPPPPDDRSFRHRAVAAPEPGGALCVAHGLPDLYMGLDIE